MMTKDVPVSVFLVLVAVASRLVSHQWNLTAMGAVAIVAAFVLSNRLLPFIVTLVSLLVSDSFLAPHDNMVSVYLAFILMATISLLIVSFDSRRPTVKTVFISGVLGSLTFFTVSNFGVWQAGVLYPKTFAGLIECYAMALPFFKNEVLSNLIVAPTLFIALSRITMTAPAEFKSSPE